MIVVTAPTGNIGHRVINDLLKMRAPVRIVARNPDKLPPDVRNQVEVIEGSHGDGAVIARALDGAEALFWLLPPDPTATSIEQAYLDFGRPAAEAIRRHGNISVVAIAALGRGTPLQAEAGFVTASLAWTTCCPRRRAPIERCRAFTLQAALDGIGIAFLKQATVAPLIAEGRIVPLLEAWAAPFPGFFLCAPRHGQMAPAMRVVVDAIVARFASADHLPDQAAPAQRVTA